MKTFATLTLALLLASGAPAAHADNYCAEKCIAALREAAALEGQGKYNEALERYRAIAKDEPLASLPVSMEANLILMLSGRVKPEKVDEFRNAARATANRALRLGPEDPVAQEVLRRLDDDGPSPVHSPNAAARPLLEAAEAQFMQRHFDEALRQYEAAAEADPQLSNAWVGAGDCWFERRDWPRAEAAFRRAVAIEPRNSQAWRYLADSLALQGKVDAAGAALYAAIAADPSQRPNWGKLASYRAGSGQVLQPLALRRGVRVTRNPDGKYVINLDESVAQDAAPPDLALRTALGASEANQRAADQTGSRSAYDIELEAWRTALKVIDEAQANKADGLHDKALLQMQALAHDGQLEPAILLLQFRQAYRPALEAWLAAHPDGIRTFVERYGLQP